MDLVPEHRAKQPEQTGRRQDCRHDTQTHSLFPYLGVGSDCDACVHSAAAGATTVSTSEECEGSKMAADGQGGQGSNHQKEDT